MTFKQLKKKHPDSALAKRKDLADDDVIYLAGNKLKVLKKGELRIAYQDPKER